MNITYNCNNQCVFCISHNTKNHTRSFNNPLKSIKDADRELCISENDIFIVNGGEPTTSSDFNEILDYLKRRKCHIVTYTNGRNFANSIFYFETNFLTSRWIVPFYGLAKTHDYFTGVKNSFYETYNGIMNLPRNARKNVSIKFLVQNDLQIVEFMDFFEKIKFDFDDFHVSLILSQNDAENRFSLAKKVTKLVNLIFNNFKSVKISNFPLCCMTENLKHIIENYDADLELKIGSYYFIAEKSYWHYPYDRNHKWREECSSCKWNKICPDNSKKYRALILKDSKSFLGEE